VSIERGFDDADPVRPQGLETVEERRSTRTHKLGSGTIACPRCDAPIAFAGASMKPRDPLSCPVCLHAGTVREFLSLAQPTRPTRVAIYVVAPSAA
jgi:hypothetical protein